MANRKSYRPRLARRIAGDNTLIRAAGAILAAFLLANLFAPPTAVAQDQGGGYESAQIIEAGHGFFGDISFGFAKLVERAASENGLPNGYILGEEASGAVIGGLRYGEGTLYTQNAGHYKVYWQGPSFGLDVGGDGARVMILVYDLPSIDHLFRRYVGGTGSAFFIGGFGMTALQNEPATIVPIRSGLGARLGVAVSYLKFTEKPTWNPF